VVLRSRTPPPQSEYANAQEKAKMYAVSFQCLLCAVLFGVGLYLGINMAEEMESAQEEFQMAVAALIAVGGSLVTGGSAIYT
jgi:hypothetical protein